MSTQRRWKCDCADPAVTFEKDEIVYCSKCQGWIDKIKALEFVGPHIRSIEADLGDQKEAPT